MYGMEEKEKREKFVFDLEKRIKNEPEHLKEILSKAEKRMAEIKKQLREGANAKEFDRLGVLLHGYAALQKVLKKAGK
ncbi:MAG TPA: EscE/YscE/SsaE family type III secretion system needle protein co-chaperone [Chlamydiales bacterium]|nr:EscE/YscE/SsaE family type III secretion system needle protein co-chaperone [Chlamydiales bacterium]